MNDVAEDFNNEFEAFKNISAHRIRLLTDLDDGNGMHLLKNKELVGFIINGKIYLDGDEIEVLAENDPPEEDQ